MKSRIAIGAFILLFCHLAKAHKCLPGCSSYQTTYIIVYANEDKDQTVRKGKELASKLKSDFKDETPRRDDCSWENKCLAVFKINESDKVFVAGYRVGNQFKSEISKAKGFLKSVRSVVKDAYIKLSNPDCICE